MCTFTRLLKRSRPGDLDINFMFMVKHFARSLNLFFQVREGEKVCTCLNGKIYDQKMSGIGIYDYVSFSNQDKFFQKDDGNILIGR